MSRVIVYVEGPSDKAAMEALLEPLLKERRQQGVAIDFLAAPGGDRKKSLLLKVPERAVNILASQSKTLVVVVPDLYPRNRGFPHENVEELMVGVAERFQAAVQRKKLRDGARLARRFRAFCFKHDLEALILASHEALAGYLGQARLVPTWREPVEEQDHEEPPKRIVEELFRRHGKTYQPVVDAPLVLRASSFEQVAERCPQCFGPFVEFLRSAG